MRKGGIVTMSPSRRRTVDNVRQRSALKKHGFLCFSCSCFVVFLTLAVALAAVAQDQRATTARSYGLSGENIPPWHLKVNYEIFDRVGNMRDWGTYEEFWVNAKCFRRTYSNTRFSTVEYGTDKGILRSGNSSLPTLPLEELRRAIITPVDVGTATFGEPIAFYGHLLPRKIVIEHAGRTVLAARLVSIEPLKETDGVEFQPPADASPESIPLIGAITGSIRASQGQNPK
jgi:hypothetical protein